jgi:hypothetical protein
MQSFSTNALRCAVRTSVGITVLVLMVLVTPAFSCYSGLLVIPTPDVVTEDEYSVELQYDFQTPVESDTSATFVNTEIGIAKNLELGLDIDVSDSNDKVVLANGKYAFSLANHGKTQAAIGTSTFNSRFKSIPYFVTGTEVPFGRIFTGVSRSDGKSNWFVGMDHEVNSKTTLMADYTNGNENFWSVAANYQFTDNFGVLAGVEVPNDGSGDLIYSVHIVLCGKAHTRSVSDKQATALPK